MKKLKCKYCGGELKHYPGAKYFEYLLLDAPAIECKTSSYRITTGYSSIGEHKPITKEEIIQRLLEKTDLH